MSTKTSSVPRWVHVETILRCSNCGHAVEEGFLLYETQIVWRLALCVDCAELALDGDEELAELINGA